VNPALTDLAYLLAAVLFIFGLKGLTHPRTAVRGNLIGALGMLIAALATVTSQRMDLIWVVAGLAIGAAVGAVMAVRVRMTAMPQMVAVFNGFGGGASLLVAGAYLLVGEGQSLDVLIATAASGLIGAVTFSGSMVAWAKLEELKSIKDVRFTGQQLLSGLLFLVCLVLSFVLVTEATYANVAYWIMVAVALGLGVSLVVPIGGADMPVVIALLNSYSGLAAAATGFVLTNNVLIIAGSLVGASGIILTRIMCKAMNRSLAHVMFGTLQPTGEAASADDIYATVKSTTPEEAAMLLEAANRVLIVPGYGMAAAQAQHSVSELAKLLQQRQVKVEFGIHPVAGRMPGHMNVLLAEADVPYDLLKEMDEVNAEMDQIDVAIVLGANDVVNPVARTDPESPIAGMPVIEVDRAKTVVVIKRSLSPGFAGIPNPLFAAPNTLMLFGDGRQAVTEILNALKEAA